MPIETVAYIGEALAQEGTPLCQVVRAAARWHAALRASPEKVGALEFLVPATVSPAAAMPATGPTLSAPTQPACGLAPFVLMVFPRAGAPASRHIPRVVDHGSAPRPGVGAAGAGVGRHMLTALCKRRDGCVRESLAFFMRCRNSADRIVRAPLAHELGSGTEGDGRGQLEEDGSACVSTSRDRLADAGAGENGRSGRWDGFRARRPVRNGLATARPGASARFCPRKLQGGYVSNR